jgi:amino acid transporter
LVVLKQTGSELPRRRFPLWVGLALSVATVGPTLAMAGNGQGLVASVGKAVPLVFVIGLLGVSLVGYSFVRLTRHLNHAGSAYALVGATIGPRAGFFAGFAMLGAYISFSIGTLALTAIFANAFLAELQRSKSDPYQLPWLVPILIAGALSLRLTGRDARVLAKILLAIEGLGILAMIVLSAVIVARGGAAPTGVDFAVFSTSGVSVAAVLGGVVAAFLCWAGFEACVSMGEETADPQRNIPRALIGTLALTGVLFVAVMFAQTIGFGTDAAGLKAFAGSANTLGDLSDRYIGEAFSLLISFTAVVGAFGCHMATGAISGRLLYAFARDGLGGDLDVLRLRGGRLGLPDGLLPAGGARRPVVHRGAAVRGGARGYRPGFGGGAAGRRCGGDHRRGVVQREGCRRLAGSADAGAVLVCDRRGGRAGCLRGRRKGR